VILDNSLHVYEIPLAQIEPDPEQPRKAFDQVKLNELARSIKQSETLDQFLRKLDTKPIVKDIWNALDSDRVNGALQPLIDSIMNGEAA